jgi:membrane protease subunit (stomatin/prohibitin family)
MYYLEFETHEHPINQGQMDRREWQRAAKWTSDSDSSKLYLKTCGTKSEKKNGSCHWCDKCEKHVKKKGS